MISLFYILIFPGFLFLSAFGLAAEFFDRKLYAKLEQYRKKLAHSIRAKNK